MLPKTLNFTQFSIVFAFLFSFITVSTGCKSSKASVNSGDTLPQALLWKIEGKDIKEPSYLFGTIHIIGKDDFFLPSGFEEAFDQSEEVMFEIDMNEMTDMGMMMGLLTNLMMKDGVTLQKLLSAAEYKEVSGYFEEMGLPMFLLNKVKPMFLSMLAEVNMDPSELQSDDMVSYEMDLFDKANAAGKEVGGLETMAYQMSLFDSIPYKDQAMMLLDAVRGTEAEVDAMDEIVKMYKMQDIESMVSLVNDTESKDDSGFEKVLLTNRNENWISVMSKQMSTTPTFFAVGAGHLGGKNGVIRLLRKEGYALTPVSVYKANTAKRV